MRLLYQTKADGLILWSIAGIHWNDKLKHAVIKNPNNEVLMVKLADKTAYEKIIRKLFFELDILDLTELPDKAFY